MIGVYFSIYALVRVKSAMSAKPPPPAPVAAPVATSGSSASKWGFEPPASVEDLDRWGANEANWKAWEKFMDGPGIEKWAESIE